MTLEIFQVGRISVVILIRTDTTLDHSQEAEKVWLFRSQLGKVTHKTSGVAVFVFLVELGVCETQSCFEYIARFDSARCLQASDSGGIKSQSRGCCFQYIPSVVTETPDVQCQIFTSCNYWVYPCGRGNSIINDALRRCAFC